MKDKIVQHLKDYDIDMTNNIHEAIYIIDGYMVDGGFCEGYRGVDHNILLCDGITWVDILMNGVVIVHETKTYISDTIHDELNALGYERLPLTKNHIVGY